MTVPVKHRLMRLIIMSFKYITFSVTGNTRFLPVHSHCIGNYCSLQILFIMISKGFISSKLVIVYRDSTV